MCHQQIIHKISEKLEENFFSILFVKQPVTTITRKGPSRVIPSVDLAK